MRNLAVPEELMDEYRAGIGNIGWIGDLSFADVYVLIMCARQSPKILEFGAGGSTQIFSQCRPKTFISVETDHYWREITIQRLQKIRTPNPTHVQFVEYGQHPKRMKFNLIFVDGVSELRRDFAMRTFSQLDKRGGMMLFHDTRRLEVIEDVMFSIQMFHNEIVRVDFNACNSNITIMHKKPEQPYLNWNFTENKPLWAYGSVPDTEDKELWTFAQEVRDDVP